MNDEFRGLAVFAAVADAGSFSAAGRQLKLSTSVVSHHVTKLESKLGVSLFYRTTRALSLTAEGQQIIDAARRMVSAGEEAMDALSGQSEQPVGALRVTLPAFGTSSAIHQAVWSFAKAHPMVALYLRSSDRAVDLVREGFDLAIRLGTLSDSTLRSRRIGSFHRRLVASPAYLKGRAPVRDIDDLVACDFISLAMIADSMTLNRKNEDVTVTLQNFRLEVDSVTAGKAAVLAGLGVMNLPLNEVEMELDTGELVEVAPKWKLPSLGIYAVWPDSGPQKMLTRRLIDHFVERQASLSM